MSRIAVLTYPDSGRTIIRCLAIAIQSSSPSPEKQAYASFPFRLLIHRTLPSLTVSQSPHLLSLSLPLVVPF